MNKEAPAQKKTPGNAPRKYIGPLPAPEISNLPCGCNHTADNMSREEQDFLIQTVPYAAAWYEE